MGEPRVSTGIGGLDDILWGGLPPCRFFLMQGDPGVGRTTIGLQFLLEGERRRERGLYVTFGEALEQFSGILTGVPRRAAAP